MPRTLPPGVASLGDGESGEDAVDRLLREAVASMAASDAPADTRATHAALRQLPAEAILALARVLSGPTGQRYRVASGSRAGAFYTLDLDGGDVTCTCAGFGYRGACSHARTVTAALAAGRGGRRGTK